MQRTRKHVHGAVVTAMLAGGLFALVLTWASETNARQTFTVTQHYAQGRKVVGHIRAPGQYDGTVPGQVAAKMERVMRQQGGPKSIALTHVSTGHVGVGNLKGMKTRTVDRFLLRQGDTRTVNLAQLRFGRTARLPRDGYFARGNVPGATIQWPDKRFRPNSVVLQTSERHGPRALTQGMYQAYKQSTTTLSPPLRATPAGSP